jgi:hypothetical protein
VSTSTSLPPKEPSLDVPTGALTGSRERPILTAARLRELLAILERTIACRRAEREAA